MADVSHIRQLVAGIVFCCLTLTAPAQALAAIVYANSATGNDTTGNGTSGTPYKTFNKAYTVASAGDTLNLSGTFTWTDADETGDAVTSGYTISKNLTIQGQSATSTIIQADSTTGTADRRVFTLGSGTSVTFSDVDIRYGNVAASGGGVSGGSGFNNTVVFRNCILEYNNATAGDGGGYYSKNTTSLSFTMDNCLVRYNTSNTASGNVFGGGLHLSSGQSTITNSTFTANRSKTGGSGIYYYYGSVTLTNSTLMGNIATSGPAFFGHYGSGSQILTNDTIAYNSVIAASGSAGIDPGSSDAGVYYIKNTILAQNTNASAQSDLANSYGATFSVSNSIVETQATSIVTNGVSGNIVGVQANLRLSSTLADNSTTRSTQTLALSSGSVAIDAGTFTANSTVSIPWTDQRGLYRSGVVDIGAYEYGGLSALSAPATAATNAVFTSVSQPSMTISWTSGDGGMRAVFVKQANAGTASPADATTYTASTVFGSGTQIGATGWYTVYKGTGTSVSISGLAPGTDYTAHVVEFNGAAGEEKYLSTAGTGNPAATTTLVYTTPTSAATNATFGNVSNRTATVSWTNGNGSSREVFIKQGSSGSASPTDATTYTANAAFGSGTQIGSSGWYAVYKGTGTSVSVSNLSYDSDYQVHVVELNGTAGYEKYYTTSGTNNPKTRSAYAGTTIYSNYSTGNDTTGGGTSGSPYKTFHKAYTTAIDGDTLNLTGTFSWTNSDETGDAATSGYSLAKVLTITGQTATTTILQATSTDNTADRRVFTISASTTIKNLTLRYGKTSSGGCVQTTSAIYIAFRNVDVFSCRSTSIGGAFYLSAATTTIENSSIRSNTVDTSHGGAIYMQSSAAVFLTNSTITGNTTASASAYYGGAIYSAGGTAWLTNSTITGNTSNRGTLTTAAASAIFYLKNTILAGNTATNAADTELYKSSSGTFTSSGYNIIGRHTSTNIATSTGDWKDAAGSGTFLLSGGGTGTLSLNGTAVADATYGTYTHALQTGSIGIDQGTTTSHAAGGQTVAVPTTDQRAYYRNGATDIGAYEYNGSAVGDTVPPSVSLISPAASEATSSTMTLAASSSDDVALAGVSFYVDGVLQGSEDTSAPYAVFFDTTATTSSSHTAFAVARDTSSNYATSSSVTFSIDNQATPTSVSATAATTSASITWTTPRAGSSRLYFGFTTAIASSTPEADASSRVTSHSMSLGGLPACAAFKFVTVSKNAVSEVATSSQSAFKTAGCTGGASILAHNEDDISASSGGSLAQGNVSLSIPASFTSTSSSATFQASKIDNTAFYTSAGRPTGKNSIGTDVYTLKAYTDTSSSLSTFSQPVSVTFSYSASDVSGYDESSLQIYRYDGSSWNALSGCSVNTSARTVTCTTTHFSDFAIFGDTSSAGASATTVSGGNGPVYAGRASDLPGYIAPRAQTILPDGTRTFGGLPTASDHANGHATLQKFARTLRGGSRGGDVRELQRFLNEQGFLLARKGAGSPGQETDAFGPMTYNALVRFQNAHASDILAPIGLKKGTGIFSTATRAYVNSLLEDAHDQ